ncbi:MAG: DUF1559 domain-containing protein [Thermoleophilia bacterium]|nr:DUF1559 domain-containing protein [Thermoleophilia bacterium]
MLRRPSRAGVTLAEVVVVAVVIAFAILIVMAALPRRREGARIVSCRNNLMQIGQALAQYDRAMGRLPLVNLGPPASGPGPCLVLLEGLGIPDFYAVDPNGTRKDTPTSVPGGGRVPGFLCQSDPNAFNPAHASPLSYRACTGDAPAGSNGIFAPGRSISTAEVEEGDGSSYTAAFAERLLGTGVDGQAHPANYGVIPLTPEMPECPPVDPSAWKGDAGGAWPVAGWSSTLYNHALTPNAPHSCVDPQDKLAFLGASSGHVEGVNVLILDGSVRTIRPTIAPPIWKALATTHSPPPSSPPPSIPESLESPHP